MGTYYSSCTRRLRKEHKEFKVTMGYIMISKQVINCLKNTKPISIPRNKQATTADLHLSLRSAKTKLYPQLCSRSPCATSLLNLDPSQMNHTALLLVTLLCFIVLCQAPTRVGTTCETPGNSLKESRPNCRSNSFSTFQNPVFPYLSNFHRTLPLCDLS